MSEKNSPELKRRKIETPENVNSEDNQNTDAEKHDQIIAVCAKQIKTGDFVPTNTEDSENSKQEDPEDVIILDDDPMKTSIEVEEQKFENSEEEKRGNTYAAETNSKTDENEIDEKIIDEEVIDQTLGEFEKTKIVEENQNADFPKEDNAKENNVQANEQSVQIHEDNNSSEKTELRINQTENKSSKENEQNENQCEKLGDELCDKQSGDEETEPPSNANAKEDNQLDESLLEETKKDIDNRKEEVDEAEKRFPEKNQENNEKCDETLEEPNEGGEKKGNEKEINTGDQKLSEDLEKSGEIIDHVKKNLIEECEDGDEKVKTGEEKVSGEQECPEGNEKENNTGDQELSGNREKSGEIIDHVKKNLIEECEDGDEKVKTGEEKVSGEQGCGEIVDQIKDSSIKECLEGSEKIDISEEKLLIDQENNEEMDANKGGQELSENHKDSEGKVDQVKEDKSDNNKIKSLSEKSENEHQNIENISNVQSNNLCEIKISSVSTIEAFPLFNNFEEEEIIDGNYENESLQMHENIMDEIQEYGITEQDQEILAAINCNIQNPEIMELIEEIQEGQILEVVEGNYQIPENIEEEQISVETENNVQMHAEIEEEEQTLPENIEGEPVFEKDRDDMQIQNEIEEDENFEKTDLNDQIPQSIEGEQTSEVVGNDTQTKNETEEEQTFEKTDGIQISKNIEEKQISEEVEDEIQLQTEIEKGQIVQKTDNGVQIPENIEKISEIVEDNTQTQEDNETGEKDLNLKEVNEEEKLCPESENNEINESQKESIDEIKEKENLLGNDEEKTEIKENNQTENVIPELIPINEYEVDDIEVMDVDDEEENESDDAATVIEVFDGEDKEDDDNSQHHEEKLEDNLKESCNNEIKTKDEEEIPDDKKCHDSLANNIFFGKECVNAECSNKSKSFLKAPEFVINLYRLPRKNNNIQYVCENCHEFAVSKYESYCDALVNHRLLFDEEIPKRHEVVEILDSDEEDNVNDAKDSADEEYLSKEVIDYLDDNIDEVLEEICEKVKIKDQLSMMNTAFDNRLEKLQGELNSQNSVLKELQTNANRMYSELYSCQRIKIKELPSLDLNTGRTYVAETEFTIPPQGDLTYLPIKINGCYFAMRNKLIDNWLPCRLIEISDVTPLLKFYRVKFENSKSPITRCISAKQLAYFDPPSVKLPIGTRVIALFDSTILHGKNSVKNALYPGIIAEPLTSYNRYRYLIFFDDGYSQYVSHKDVRLVCFASENVWEDVHISSKEFFRSYLTQYQKNRPMVQAKKGQTITTESNGKWLPAKVIDIDGSLVQMQFSGKNHTEWIYRGSTRLAPLYKERYNSKKATALSQLPRRTEPFIRYMENDESSISSRLQNNPPSSVSQSSTVSLSSTTTPSSTVTSRAVAKKSVTKSPYSPITSSFQQQQQISHNQRQVQLHQHQIHQPQPSVKHLNNSVIIVDDDDSRPKGKVVYYTAKKNLPPRQYQLHECNPECLFSMSYNLNSYSPLAKPLLLGWERLIHRLKLKKWVQYRAPCGRILRNMEEIHRYLRSTKNTLNVDNFDFDPMVHCLAEYVIEKCIVQKPDLSDGTENMIIPCINYYDNTMPPPCKYSTERLPTQGVHLNLDQEFLVGCDCTDDCSDKTKCSCWQLTLEGARFNNSNIPLDKIGYSYKRLPEPVPTGIYECNIRCKCSKNCLNRVVQHPLQMKLQVFKTSNRGWGLRCINDIPKGSFICIYAGHLLTEQNANEGGAHFGDEYFAELDYIEVVERLKEGYESDVQEDIESDDDSEERNRGNDSDEEFRLHTKISTKSPSVHTRMQTRRETAKSSRSGSTDDDGADGENRRKILNFDANPTMDNSVESTSTKYKSVRKYFGKDEYCYVMDAKLTGNIGRYFNHSCSPNLFVQNVFVDTHDLRFPWVAFFALHHIKAGTELTWNYNYEVGIVPGKVLYCECGASNCRGRLL